MQFPVSPPPALDTIGRCGELEYHFGRRGAQTVLTRASCTSPWHFFPPTSLDDTGCAYTWLVNPSGGLVGGDHVTVTAVLQPGSHVLMTSPSANRVYRSLSAPSIQNVQLTVGAGARLEWIPEVTIPYAGARFQQTIHVDLAADAAIVLWDAFASGRIAMNERWAFATYDNEILIRSALGSLVIERVRLTPDTVGTLVRAWDYVGSLFVLGETVTSSQLIDLESKVLALCDAQPGVLLGGVSQLTIPGVAIKVVARSAPALSTFLDAALAEIRVALWQLSAPVLRRY